LRAPARGIRLNSEVFIPFPPHKNHTSRESVSARVASQRLVARAIDADSENARAAMHYLFDHYAISGGRLYYPPLTGLAVEAFGAYLKELIWQPGLRYALAAGIPILVRSGHARIYHFGSPPNQEAPRIIFKAQSCSWRSSVWQRYGNLLCNSLGSPFFHRA